MPARSSSGVLCCSLLHTHFGIDSRIIVPRSILASRNDETGEQKSNRIPSWWGGDKDTIDSRPRPTLFIPHHATSTHFITYMLRNVSVKEYQFLSSITTEADGENLARTRGWYPSAVVAGGVGQCYWGGDSREKTPLVGYNYVEGRAV